MISQFLCVVLSVQVCMACLSVTTPTGNTNQIAKEIVENNGCVSTPLDILTVIDGSSSITPANFRKTQDFLIDLTNKLTGDHYFAATQFSSNSRIEFLYTDKVTAAANYNALDYKTGSTWVDKALVQAEQVLADASNRAANPDVLMLLIDGGSSDDATATAQRIRNTGVTLIVVAIGPNVDQDALEKLVDDPRLVIEAQFDTLATDVLTLLQGILCP